MNGENLFFCNHLIPQILMTSMKDKLYEKGSGRD